jgi:two-component system, OmpR family, sensor histidine kinase CiaH
MFRSARLQLTAWYLLIIMIISSLFSLVIYSSINAELERFEDYQRSRQKRYERMLERMEIRPPDESAFPTNDVDQARRRVIVTLALINLSILAASGTAGYFLAGKTLRPIQEMMSEQKRFITDASHELRTPLTALRTEIEVALREKSLSITEAKSLLRSNLEEVIALQSLSDRLITLIKNQQQSNSIAEISLNRVIENARKKVAVVAKKKRITLRQSLGDIRLSGNSETLTELFVILLDNAIKYSPKGSSVIVESKRVKSSAVITVADSGSGIDKKDLPNIFDRFYRADTARTRSENSGHGLGLSIAKKIVDDHSGKITVRSTVGKGTTFTILLPLS